MEKNPLLCPVCAGSDYVRKKLYPETKYCKSCGIALAEYDFSKMKNLFGAMSSLRLIVELSRLEDKKLQYYCKNINDIFKSIEGAVEAFDDFRGQWR